MSRRFEDAQERTNVLYDVYLELQSAEEKHGFDNTPMNGDTTSVESGFIILAEEFGEVARALTRDGNNKENLRQELIQTAAMAVAMVCGYDDRKGKVG